MILPASTRPPKFPIHWVSPYADTATPVQRIEAALESHATIIAKVTDIDVEIMDANLNTITR